MDHVNSKKELLFSITKKDFVIQYFSGTGKGGQHRNKHQNCVRLKHLDSEVITTGQNSKSRKTNLKEAFKNLAEHPKFKFWHTQKVNEILVGKRIDEIIVEMINEKNLKVEVKNKAGQWVEENNDII